jgi:hypothetical protein
MSMLRLKENSHIFFSSISSSFILSFLIINLQNNRIRLHSPWYWRKSRWKRLPNCVKTHKRTEKHIYWKKVYLVSMYYLFNGVRIWQRVCIPLREEKIMAKTSRHRRNPIVSADGSWGEVRYIGVEVMLCATVKCANQSNMESTIEEGTCRGQCVPGSY